jgi:hypothetical protein
MRPLRLDKPLSAVAGYASGFREEEVTVRACRGLAALISQSRQGIAALSGVATPGIARP